jgi:phage terminase large subunit-like protein
MRLVLAAPRGFAKSSIGARIYPLWLGLYRHRKDICIISASESLAIEHLRWIKTEIEGNAQLIEIWGDLRSDKWTENHLILQHKDGTKINIRAKGAGAQIRGFRPDCLILDDIETDESVTSEEQRKKLKDWLFKACLNTLLPDGQLLIIGTVIHPLSVLAELLAVENGWEKRRYKAYIDGVEEAGHELWAEERPHEWLQQRKKEIGTFAFASEFLNDPRLDASAPIKEEQIRYWTELPKQYSSVITVDPAYSEDEKSDYKVASLIGIDQNLNRYLINYIRTHSPTGEFIDAVLNMYLQNKGTITAIGVPSGGTEKMFYTSMLKRAEERKIYAPFVELTNTFITSGGQKVREKTKRITACLQPLFEQGKYYINGNHYDVRDELLTIGYSRWDDIVDTLAYAEQVLQPRYEEPKEYKFDDRGYMVEDEIHNNYGF